mgnify:CR=1 FL=1
MKYEVKYYSGKISQSVAGKDLGVFKKEKIK